MKIEFDQSMPLGATRVTLTTDGTGVTYEVDGPIPQGDREPGGRTRDVSIPLPAGDALAGLTPRPLFQATADDRADVDVAARLRRPTA